MMAHLPILSNNTPYNFDVYDPRLQAILVRFQEFQYLPEYLMTQYIKRSEFNDFKFFNNIGCQAFVVSTDKFVIISFRGTQVFERIEFKDWIPHFRIRSKVIDNKKVHNGYYNFYSHIKNELQEYVNKISNNKQILITGHQLGGVLAQIAGEFDYQDAVVYAFGAPRCVKFKNTNNRIFQITTSKDIISDYPQWIFRLSHLGERLSIDKNFNISQANTVKNRLIENTLMFFISSILPFAAIQGLTTITLKRQIKNHQIEEYIRLVEGNANKTNR